MLSSVPIAAIGALVVSSLTGYVLALNIMAGNTIAALACMAGVLAIAIVSGMAVAKHEDLLDGEIHHPDPKKNALTGFHESQLRPLPENLAEVVASRANDENSVCEEDTETPETRDPADKEAEAIPDAEPDSKVVENTTENATDADAEEGLADDEVATEGEQDEKPADNKHEQEQPSEEKHSAEEGEPDEKEIDEPVEKTSEQSE